MKPSNSTVFQLLDPLCWFKDPVAEGNEEVGDSPVVLDVPIGGMFEYVFVVPNAIMEPVDLLLEAMDFDVFLGIVSGDGCKEPFHDGSEDVSIEIRVCCQCGRNGTGRHRWFRALDRANWERSAVFGG